jgi:hypothetical protein
MANYTHEEITTATSGKIGSVAGLANVITDTRFVEETSEFDLIEMIRDKNLAHEATGVLLALVGVENIIDENPCKIIVAYHFEIAIFIEYRHKRGDGLTSKKYFEACIFALNEVLNSDRALGLDNRVEHQCLQADDDFAVIDWGNDHGSLLTHFAKFRFIVEVENAY